MDFSRLDQNERTAAVASGALVIAGVFAASTYPYSMTWLAVIAALGMLFVVFQPQVAARVSLPGSKGSLILVFGLIAGTIMVLSLFVTFSLVFSLLGLPEAFYLVAVAAGVAMAWAGWRAFQAEGGRFRVGAAPVSPAPADSAVPSDAEEDRSREA
jgi:threonine/homoserine/homoserine lactone efflux protein